MIHRILADTVVLVHLGFVLFVVLGGLLLLRWPRVAWIHLPAAAWGAFVELAGRTCPLTPLENHLRARGGGPGHAGGFLDRYLVPVLYPEGLDRRAQVLLGLAAILINGVVYLYVIRGPRSPVRRSGR